MSKRSVTHGTFTIERSFKQPPARVFAAFGKLELKQKWFKGPEEWSSEPHTLEFKIGGRERVAGGPKGGPVHRYDAVYRDIVADERIVTSYEMHADDALTSVSVASIELRAQGSGTLMVITESGVFLDGLDNAGERERGTGQLLDALDTFLSR
jgi:uncharacterized protein YndB with AHSA1/START domain